MMQLQLPPFSQFVPSLLLLLVLGWTAAWIWSVWLLATGSEGVRRLPVWLWAVFLVLVPVVTAPVFLLIGAPVNSSRARRWGAIAAMTAVVVTVAVVGIQQIGILDCRVAPKDRLTEVCTMAPRSATLPVLVGLSAAIVVVAFAMRRRHPARSPQPLAT
jgi:hypothetical protein